MLKRFTVLVLMALMLVDPAWAVTEFVATVKTSAGDYTTMNGALTGLQNDLTASTIKVFSISAKSTPTLAAGDTVLGQTSAATGVCVLVNAAGTQVLIKTIAVAAFQSGEVVQKTTDAAVNVTLSNAGDSPIAAVELYAMADTVLPTVSSTFVTNATNYVHIYAAAGAEAKIPYNTSTAYRLEPVNGTNNVLTINTNYVMVDGIEITCTISSGDRKCLRLGTITGAGIVKFERSVIKGVTTSTGLATAVSVSDNDFTLKISNSLIYDFTTTSSVGIYNQTSTGSVYAYNVTVINSLIGFKADAGSTYVCKNCLYDSQGLASADGYTGTMTGSNYNSSDLASDVTGANSVNSQVNVYVNEAGDDFHLGADPGVDAGTDLSGDATYPITVDFDNVTRTGSWDIGADETTGGGGGGRRRILVE